MAIYNTQAVPEVAMAGIIAINKPDKTCGVPHLGATIIIANQCR